MAQSHYKIVVDTSLVEAGDRGDNPQCVGHGIVIIDPENAVVHQGAIPHRTNNDGLNANTSERDGIYEGLRELDTFLQTQGIDKSNVEVTIVNDNDRAVSLAGYEVKIGLHPHIEKLWETYKPTVLHYSFADPRYIKHAHLDLTHKLSISITGSTTPSKSSTKKIGAAIPDALKPNSKRGATDMSLAVLDFHETNKQTNTDETETIASVRPTPKGMEILG